MKRDVVFFSSKRFEFEKIEENNFRLDIHQNGRSQSNLRSRVKKNQDLSIVFLERQSIQLSKTG